MAVDSGGRTIMYWEGMELRAMIEPVDGVYYANVTAWASSPDDLPTGVTLTVIDGWGEADMDLAFSAEVAVLFGIEAILLTDPHGLDLVGTLSLQGEADEHGRRKTLSRGHFAGQFGTDSDGDTDLTNIDLGGATQSRGDILIGGEPIDIEKEDGGGGPGNVPPVLFYYTGGGATRMNSQLTTYR
jgi:hypothetical protein